jgi:N-acetylmuramoyl-L-alanine amidase
VIRSLGDVVKIRRKNVEQAAFVVLKSADIPSLLIESGYITNPNDAKNLDSPVWRQRFAGALAEGITHWFHERPPQGTWVAWQKENGGLIPATYTVKRGDSLSEIAERYRIPMSSLKSANDLSSNVIRIGQVLTLPGTTAAAGQAFTEHKIARGETLSQIAASYAVPMARIRETNQLKSDTIRVGQVLKIPTS